MNIKNLKVGNKSVEIVVQVKSKSDVREFDRFGLKHRMATAVVEDRTGKIEMPLFDEKADLIKVGDTLRIINSYVGEFKGNKQLNIGRYGKLEIINPREREKDFGLFLKDKKIEKKIQI